MLYVDLVMRSDFMETFGGDVVQVQHYEQHMPSDINLRVMAAGPRLRLRDASVVHIVNIDREWDYLEVTHQAGARPIVVTPIHHHRSAVDEIRGLRRASLRTIVESVLPSPTFALLTRLYRGRSWLNAGQIPFLAFVRPTALRRRVGEALVRADIVHVLAKGEQRSTERDYSVTLQRVVVIPNGVEASPRTGPARERDVPILVPGRIDPRKNQVAVAEALHKAGQAAVFVGAPHPRGGEYVDRFAHLAESSPWITWIRGVPPEHMSDWYQRSKVVLNLSLVEVLSLVDLEAYTCGCVLVTTTKGHTIEWLGSAASYVDPTQVGRAVTVVREKLAGWIPTESDPEIVRQFDWARIGSELADVYRSVARNHGSLAQ